MKLLFVLFVLLFLFLLGFSLFPYCVSLLIVIVLLSSSPIPIYLLLALPPHPVSLSLPLALPLLSLPLPPLYITVLICFVFLFDLFTALVRFIPFRIQPGQSPLTIHPPLPLPLHNTRRSVLVGHLISIRWPLLSASNTNLPGLLDYLLNWCWTLITIKN